MGFFDRFNEIQEEAEAPQKDTRDYYFDEQGRAGESSVGCVCAQLRLARHPLLRDCSRLDVLQISFRWQEKGRASDKLTTD